MKNLLTLALAGLLLFSAGCRGNAINQACALFEMQPLPELK